MLLLSNFPAIVMLHYVSDNPVYNDLRPWNINTTTYIRLLDYLELNNYRTIGFEDLLTGRRRSKDIIITFDDCPKELWDFAIPELQRRNMKAVFYMPTAHLGGYNEWNVADGKPRIGLMDEGDIARLVEKGMEVGSHAHNHCMLEEMDESEVISQLSVSKSILESIIGKPVISVAYPYGSLPAGYKHLTEGLGYKFGLGVYVPWQSMSAIRRWVYDDTDDTASIKRKTSKFYNWYRAWQDKWDFYSKRCFRWAYNNYARMKNTLHVNTVFSVLFIEEIGFTELFWEFCLGV